MLQTAFLYDPIFLLHDTGASHVERADRLRAIRNRLTRTGILNRMAQISPRPATREILELVHTPAYVDLVEADTDAGSLFLSTDHGLDTRLSPDTLPAALMAAGSVLTAVDAVLAGEVRNAFCCVRPPGHHASHRAGRGFCIFNNVAIGAAYVRRRHNLKRVLIMDWDVHHGNGTQDIFEDEPDVFFASSHQAGIYPGSGMSDERGIGSAVGTTLNMPMAAFTTQQEFIDVWKEQLPRAMKQFEPEMVFISAGFDSHRDDLLGSLGMTATGFAEMTRLAMEIAHRFAGDRVVSVLEGGYNVDALADSVEAHVLALMSEVEDD